MKSWDEFSKLHRKGQNEMKKTLACLHAHHSNITYIEKALSPYEVELVHFVDPGLIRQVSLNENFTVQEAQNKVSEQLHWIARCNVEAILITCTNYIALLNEDILALSIPIIKIDEPYFESICRNPQSQVLVFTNPATVSGTMQRLYQYANDHQKIIDTETVVIENTFDLIMSGQKQHYDEAIIAFINAREKDKKSISVAQLSMVDAAKKVGAGIINPLDPLIEAIVSELGLTEI